MRSFFFAPESPRPLALGRIAVGLVFLYDAAVRWPFAVELYSSDGMPMPLFFGASFDPVPLSATATVAIGSLLLFALTMVTVGWHARLSLWIAVAISLWLGLLDGAGTFKKYSVIGLHLMLLLSLTPCSAAWSVDALFARSGSRCTPLSLAWPRRLMQVLVCAVYFGGAITKIRLPDFANGDLLMFSLLDDQWGGSDLGLWLSTQPNLLILVSMGTVLFEIAFPLLIWNRRLRRPLLLTAFAFHLTLAAAMQLGIFSFVMLAALLSFVTEDDLRLATGRPSGKLMESIRLVRYRFVASLFGWMAVAVLTVGGGVALHRGREPANASRFQTIDDETATDMLAALTPAQLRRYGDYFHRVELGNRLSADGTHALGSSSAYRRGETVYACARLLQNHPPLQLEWTLIRPDGEETKYGYKLAATVSHATVGFALTDAEQTPAGEYRLVLRADGYQVATRGFVLSDE